MDYIRTQRKNGRLIFFAIIIPVVMILLIAGSIVGLREYLQQTPNPPACIDLSLLGCMFMILQSIEFVIVATLCNKCQRLEKNLKDFLVTLTIAICNFGIMYLIMWAVDSNTVTEVYFRLYRMQFF